MASRRQADRSFLIRLSASTIQYIVSPKHIHRFASARLVLWGRLSTRMASWMASCAAIGNRRASGNDTGSGGPMVWKFLRACAWPSGHAHFGEGRRRLPGRCYRFQR